MQIDTEAVVHELTQGAGYVMLEGFHMPLQVREAREAIYHLAETEPDRTSHFHGSEAVRTQKRVWNLVEKAPVFRDMCSDPRLLAILEPILGDVRLASFAANVLYPGAPAQEGHVDYPYWDLHKREGFPRALNASFFLEVETLVMLDDFTLDNGATALVPYSQKQCVWPSAEDFAQGQIRATGTAGTLLLFPALTWHAGQANVSSGTRAALLGCYTCKFVKPLEDWRAGLSDATKAELSPRLRRLLGLDETYPAVMDALPPRSSEGTRDKEGLYGKKAA